MDSFIVRVYRRIKATGELIGTVEDVARHRTQSFRTFDELGDTLNRAISNDLPSAAPRSSPPARGRKN